MSRREEWWKDAVIVMLRHQLAVALRERPRARMRLNVTPATILRWHRIRGELAGHGIAMAPSTVWQILMDADIGPAPRRPG